jgi:hypothetical protein
MDEAVVTFALIFSERVDAANENDKVMMAANAMRINDLVFMIIFLRQVFKFDYFLRGSCVPPPPFNSVEGVISSSVQAEIEIEVVIATKRIYISFFMASFCFLVC